MRLTFPVIERAELLDDTSNTSVISVGYIWYRGC